MKIAHIHRPHKISPPKGVHWIDLLVGEYPNIGKTDDIHTLEEEGQ